MSVFSVVDGWIGLHTCENIYSTLNVVRSLYLYYNRHPTATLYSFLSDPVFINRVNTLSKQLEYQPKSARPDGFQSILHDIQQEDQRQRVQHHLGLALYEKQRARQNARNDDQIVPTTPVSDSEDSQGTSDTEPLDQSDGFNNSSESNNTTPATTTTSSSDDQENQDPDASDTNDDV